jgi:HSP20 family protein
MFSLSQPEYLHEFWRPSADVYRTSDAWLLKFDLAGVKLEDLQITVAGTRLTVSGVRRDWMVTQGCQAYRMEISYNQFERSVELPCNLDEADCRYEYRDGMLLVTIRQCKSQEAGS